jgi:hypothetical protein
MRHGIPAIRGGNAAENAQEVYELAIIEALIGRD